LLDLRRKESAYVADPLERGILRGERFWVPMTERQVERA
jgi:hypothetical protein